MKIRSRARICVERTLQGKRSKGVEAGVCLLYTRNSKEKFGWNTVHKNTEMKSERLWTQTG